MSARLYAMPRPRSAIQNAHGFTAADIDGLPTTRAQDESVIRISYLDSLGRLQYAVTRTTTPLADLQSLDQFRSRVAYYYELQEGKLISLELLRERATTVKGLRIQPRLHVVRGLSGPAFGSEAD